MHSTTAAAAFALGLFATVLPSLRAVEFEGRFWIPQMSSRLRVEQNGVGTEIDGGRDLGIPDTNFPEGSLAFLTGHSRLRFSYTPIDYSGDQTVTRTLLFNGRQYTLGTRVLSGLEVRHLQLSWTYEFIDVRHGTFRLGSMVAADGFLMHGRLQAPNVSPPIDGKEDLSVGLPTVGLAMDINPHRMVNIHGEVSGLKAGDYGYFIASEAGVRILPVKHLFFTAGYRTFNLHAENSPDFARLQLRGPFVGAGIRF